MKSKLAIYDRNNDYFYTNCLKEVFLTGFKKASDVHLQHTLLCEIILCSKHFMRGSSIFNKQRKQPCQKLGMNPLNFVKYQSI